MNRFVVPLVLSIILIGAIFSIGANQNTADSVDSRLSGKSVIIQMQGVYMGVKDNVRFESVGAHDYIVVPMQDPDEEGTYEHWWSLEKVYAIKTFDSKEAAVEHDKKTSPFRNRDSAGTDTKE